jgi:rubrerythrin
MAGGAGEYAGAVAANYQLAAGLPFCALGVADPPEAEGYEAAVEVDERARTCRKLITRSGTLVGACFIGDLSEAAEVEQKLRATGASAPPPAARTTPQPRGPVPPSKRPSAMHKMTEQHLKEAFAGESQAHLKYRSFAERAEEEGKANVARLFKAASYSEQVHATRHLEVLEGVGSTAENLAGAVAGEGFEIDEMYPAYIAVAVEQDEPEAQETFNHALETEKVHRELYQRAKGAVAAGGDAAIETLWVCNYCGFTMEGEPPDQCPLCGNLRKNFVKF